MNIAVGIFAFVSLFLTFALPKILSLVQTLTSVELHRYEIWIVVFIAAIVGSAEYHCPEAKAIEGSGIWLKLSAAFLIVHILLVGVLDAILARGFPYAGYFQDADRLLALGFVWCVSFVLILSGCKIGFRYKASRIAS